MGRGFSKKLRIALDLTKLAVPFMKQKQWGRVITVTSVFGMMGGGRPWFNVAKVPANNTDEKLCFE